MISKIGLVSGACWPAALSMRNKFPESSFSSETKQAGESVKRKVTRTSFTLSSRAAFMRSSKSLKCFSVSSCSFFSFSSLRLPRSSPPFATEVICLLSNSVKKESIHSSTRSESNSTSTPFFRKISKCGLFLAALKVSPVT